MNDVEAAHPDSEALARFVLGKLSAAEQAEFERHVGECQSCCFVLQNVQDDTLVGRLRLASTPIDASKANAPLTPEPEAADPAKEIPLELRDHPRYRIVKLLGVGGMGVVYQAEHRLMERPVAVKVIGREFINHPTAVERFRQEVKAAAQLSHPNIVAAHDAEQAGDLHFLVMEYVEGVSLDRLVARRGPLPVSHACNYLRQAALGLQHASERGMVHRDIKPQNLMVTRKGQVKILDFGLARFAREQSRKELQDPALTAHGTVLGTPDYIAPEQAQDPRQADIRADVYSLGCTLYFALTGRVPFPGGNAVEKLMRHAMAKPKPLAELRPGLPGELVQVVERMMVKDPANRLQTPAEAAQALTRLGEQSAVTSAQPALPEASPLPPTLEPLRQQGGTALRFTEEESAPTRQLPKRPAARPLALSPAFLVPVSAAVLAVIALWVFLANREPDAGPKVSGGETAQSDKPRPGPQAPRSNERPVVDKPAKPGVPSVAPARPSPRVLVVLASKDFYYPDYLPVRTVVLNAQMQLRIASSTREPAVPDPLSGPDAQPVKPDLLLCEAKADDYEMLVFCGGHGVREYLPGGAHAGSAKKLIDAMLAQKKPVTALCAGPGVLAAAGALKGKRATSYPGGKPGDPDFYRNQVGDGGGEWVNEPVVTDGLIITGRDPSSAWDFARAIVAALEQKPAQAGHAQEKPVPGPAEPDGKPTAVLLVLTAHGFWQEEYGPIRKMLEDGGARVQVASTETFAKADAFSMGGGKPVKPDMLLKDVRAADHDVVIFLSGMGISEYFTDRNDKSNGRCARQLLNDMLGQGKWVAGIGYGSDVLAEAGILQGRRAVGLRDAPPRLQSSNARLARLGATWVDAPFVVDGKIITGRNPDDAEAFAGAVLQQLRGLKPAGKRTGQVLFVLPSKDFWFVDYNSPRNELMKRGIRVTVASSTKEPCIADPRDVNPREPVRPDILLSEAKAEDYDAVVFCGGKGVLNEYCSDQPHAADAQRLLKAMLAADKWVTALGTGPAILADAGVLRGKRATVFPFDPVYGEKLKAGGAVLVGMEIREDREPIIVEDGWILTGRDPHSAVAFGVALAEKLKPSP